MPQERNTILSQHLRAKKTIPAETSLLPGSQNLKQLGRALSVLPISRRSGLGSCGPKGEAPMPIAGLCAGLSLHRELF